jgi:hypothetical protein
LAEAHQTLSETKTYFGSGDECHMAYHFPLMEQLWIACQCSDPTCVQHMIAQSLDIPQNCQWATFLRNHDEISLATLPDDDRTLMSKNKLTAEMIGMLGGRASEELIFNDITSGASNDIENVTKLARKMVTRLGMSAELGPMVYGQKEELVFLGREISEQRDYSEAIAEKIDSEVQKLVNSAYLQAKKILTKYRPQLDAVATKLLEVETLSREEFDKMFPPPVKKTGGTPKLLVSK